MGAVTRSLWLPIGPANFYSAMTDPVLLQRDDGVLTGDCVSMRHAERSDYIPFLRESVLRRLIEVLPASFGYERVGFCEFSGDQDDQSRPVSLTMTLQTATAVVGLADARPAHAELLDAGVQTVTMRVDEFGFYTFSAAHDGAPGLVAKALAEHIVTVFGGKFGVNRLQSIRDRHSSEGVAAVRRYNGLSVTAPAAEQTEVASTPPRGALSFHQLNVFIEGLCNQSLLPAVFFEHYRRAGEWLEAYKRKSSITTDLDDFIREVTVAADASTVAGQLTTLHRFMMISRGSLQWMRRSVESVRRSLLDQMMAVSHRQARLIQLDLSGIDYERTPEMTGEATESQMRGYVMLVATKLPLMFTVSDGARTAMTALAGRAADLGRRNSDQPHDLYIQLAEVEALVGSWADLLDRLRVNVKSLETAVEHDWQERLLYEQEQARSEQEAMAEIERSRHGQPGGRRVGDTAYNALMLVLTVIAVFVAIRTADQSGKDALPLSEQLVELWPVVLGAAGFLVLAWAWRVWRQRRPDRDSYSFELAFRLDERADEQLVRDYLKLDTIIKVPSATFPTVTLRRLGGWRVEGISTDTTLLKVHSVAVARVGLVRYARFEIVTEIMIRRISNESQFFVRQCRMFGDSPVPLATGKITSLVRELLVLTCTPLAETFDLGAMTGPLDLLHAPASAG
ncbi:hypothetical protein F4553_006176 [Allocatelliglobosispora scoriae]|uniref:Uncharacterized protein n=1 Tax=Allocatelliglobosispora scoriae TaxID=643052 RepID=A0A841C111_9ACTN|nr:hypothetical protein [Allocatelliglobosispora scoriae]MBB5872742.1 hypothetical protein [Allocatelliglobosispora scoriae]